jgi:hypothetical protein
MTVKIPFRLSLNSGASGQHWTCFRSSCGFRCIWPFLAQANRAVHIASACSTTVHVTTLSWLLKFGCLEVWSFTNGVTQIPPRIKVLLLLPSQWTDVGGVETSLSAFFTSTLDWGEWTASLLGRFIPGGGEPPLAVELGTRWAQQLYVLACIL